MSQAPHKPGAQKFACRLHKSTAEGEVVEITFAADTESELKTRLAEVVRVVEGRMKQKNDEIMRLAEAERRRIAGPMNVRDELTHAQLAGRGARDAAAAGPAHS